MVHDPVVATTVRRRSSLEPRFELDGQEERAADVLGRHHASGRRPNILVILFDDVGWGDFGCYGGGVAVGAPPPTSTGWPAAAPSSPRAIRSLRARRRGPR